MTELLNRVARRWQGLGERTSAIVLQLLLWVLLTGFYVAWNSRPNYHFSGPIWPLILLELGFAVLLFNSLVYFIIPRLLLQARVWWALASAVAVVYA